MGQMMTLSRNQENQLRQLLQGGPIENEKSRPMMRMMAATVLLPKQRMMEPTPLGFPPMYQQQQRLPYYPLNYNFVR
jgi:hypothetical protein